MKDAEFQKLLNQCAKLAHKHRLLNKSVGKECERRFGVHYSEIDADWIIDKLDYDGDINGMKLEEFNAKMTERQAQL